MVFKGLSYQLGNYYVEEERAPDKISILKLEKVLFIIQV